MRLIRREKNAIYLAKHTVILTFKQIVSGQHILKILIKQSYQVSDDREPVLMKLKSSSIKTLCSA